MAAGVKAAELREQSDEDLVARLREAKAELFNLRVQAATGQVGPVVRRMRCSSVHDLILGARRAAVLSDSRLV